MNQIKNDEYYVKKMLNDLRFIAAHIQHVSVEVLGQNEILLDSMMFRLIQVQESAKRLTENYKASHANIPWLDIAGLRNRIVHDYGNVDLSIVYATLTEDVPWLICALETR